MRRTDIIGKTVTIAKNEYKGEEFWVEGYWDEITGSSWGLQKGNPACVNYFARILGKADIPGDDDVLYGKINGLGYLVHVSEVGDIID